MFIARHSEHTNFKFAFCTSLAGKIYTHQFSETSSSNMKQQSTAPSQREQARTRQHNFFGAQYITNYQSKTGIRSKQVRSATGSYENRLNNPSANPSLRKITPMAQKKSSILFKFEPQAQKAAFRANNIIQATVNYGANLVKQNQSIRKRSLKRKLAFNPSVDHFYAPYIYIRIINKINSLKDIQSQSIRMSFEKIYKKLISTQLTGQFTAEFMENVQKYIREIAQSHETYINPFDIILEPQLKNISKKQQFLQKVIDLWGQGQTFKLHELVKYHCIPPEDMNKQYLNELIYDLVIQMYQKNSCNKHIQYILLNSKGQQIQYVSEIYFSTQELLITPKANSHKNYLHYRSIIEQHNKSLKKTLRENIKQDFLHNIAYNKIEDTKVNYQDDPQKYMQNRKKSVEKTQKIIESKSKNRLQSKKQVYENELSLSKFLQLKPSKRNDELFTSYVLRKRRQRKQYSQILQRLRIILDPNHVYSIKSNLHDSTEQQFRKLRLYNDKYDIAYNYNPSNLNKIFLINIIQNCQIFNKKTTQQLERILNMLEIIYGKGVDNINQIFYWQFQQIYETAHGVANPDVIMKFVLNYLTFDQYAEIKKEEFFQILDICLSKSGRPQRLIKQILWNYLEKMGLVENNSLRRQNFETWYEPIKVVYLLFVSIIFGSEYESVKEMINQLISKNYPQ